MSTEGRDLRATIIQTARAYSGKVLPVVLAAGILHSSTPMSAEADFSGVISYVFEPNPQEIKPKMYNWEVTLNKADSQNGAYEIVQITRPTKRNLKAADTTRSVLVESNMIASNSDGVVDFNVYIGDKAPTKNMGQRGHAGEPIIFSGRGTGKGQSNWIVFPGSMIEQVVATTKGTRLSDGRLPLIQFTVRDDHGEQFQVDVVLRRK